MARLYFWDLDTKILNDSYQEASVDKNGNYIVPEDGTLEVPQETKKHQSNMWNGTAWELITDYRNEPVCDNDLNISYVDYLGEIKDNYILITEEQFNKIQEDRMFYIVNDGKLIKNPNYEKEKEKAERERIKNLTVTKRVFALALQSAGITYTMLKNLIATSEQAQLEWDLCVELKRDNPLLDQMCSQLSITPAMLDYIFQKANGEDVPYPVEIEEDHTDQSGDMVNRVL